MPTPEEIRATKNAYAREWRRNNPEKVKAIQERYWAKKTAQLQAAKAQAAKAQEPTQ